MNPDAYITYLERLHDDERNGRAALAALRRGLGQPPGAAPEASRYVQPALAADAPAYLEDAYYLVGSLFALQSRTSLRMLVSGWAWLRRKRSMWAIIIMRT